MKISRFLSPAFRPLDQVEEEGSFRDVTSACGHTAGMFDKIILRRIPLYLKWWIAPLLIYWFVFFPSLGLSRLSLCPQLHTSFILIKKKPTRCTISQLYLLKNSTCFGQIYCPSSRVLILSASRESTIIMTITYCCEYSIKTPDDGE